MIAGGLVPLVLALISQYGFGLHPCEMCIAQRVPYGIVIGLLIWGWWKPSSLPTLLRGSIILWIVEAGLAAYHVGIEQGWWDSASGCTSNVKVGASIEELRAAILDSPLVSCADVAFEVFGISMAGWNIVVALGLVGGAVFVLKQWRAS